ncbi:MAG: DNA polymerase III subunit gamma/tau [Acidimicrobiia bacterium]|nr:DNA polymerase III subunit gamma/tau [Acidimicrobiia bacterium]
MAYQSLYRRYRSRRFSEVKGQEQVTNALRNAVREDRVGHAYLFSGPRGTGKTSTARILAKALNCTNLQDGEPCCECESCVAIESGTSYDLQELDAASNNKVENVRDLIERVALGSPGRTKVYILDEVHMLSPGASNALLKTLEEPPPHVTFVLATTDPHKVLDTIRSRTQHYEFHLLPADVLAEHVRWVISDAGLDVAPEVVDHVVRQGGGSARDTLSALDQAVAAGGVVPEGGHVESLVDAICDGDAGLAIKAVSEAMSGGRDPRTLAEALLGRLREVFLVRMGAPLDQATASDRDRAEAWAERLGDRATTRAMEEVGQALLEMRQATEPRIALEVALVHLTRPETTADVEALTARIERLEQALAGGAAPAPRPSAEVREAPPARPSRPAPAERATSERAAAPPPVPKRGGTKRDAPAPTPEPASEPAAPAAAPAPAASSGGDGDVPERDALTIAWGDSVLPRLGGLTRAMYGGGRFLPPEDGQVVFALPNDVHRQKCEQKRPEVEAALRDHFGRDLRLRLVVDPGNAPPEAGAPSGAPRDGGAPDDDMEHIDVRDTEPAPNVKTDLDRLTDAFPGAVLEEGS